jgi:hypothetical protein
MTGSTLARIAGIFRPPSKRIDLSGLPKFNVSDSLAATIKSAWETGADIPLSGAIYGPAHWPDGKRFWDESFPYYRFLAGVVRSLECERIAEIGCVYRKPYSS